MKHASYRHGVEWIALNDEPSELDASVIKQQISVALLADLFGKTPHEVALAVFKVRVREIR